MCTGCSWERCDNGERRRRLGAVNYFVSLSACFQIFLGGSQFSFLGGSSWAIKERKCFLWRGDPAAASEVLRKCGRFDKLPSVSKRLARIGLLFRAVHHTGVGLGWGLEEEEVRDVERGGHCFTDGCGAMGREVAKKMYKALPEKLRAPMPEGYMPSAFQIRWEYQLFNFAITQKYLFSLPAGTRDARGCLPWILTANRTRSKFGLP